MTDLGLSVCEMTTKTYDKKIIEKHSRNEI